MINPDIIFGRLGNRMFQMAKLYADSKELGTDFYFQDPKYFEKYENEIRQLFGEGIGFLPYVSIHVRVGKNPVNPNEPAYSENPFYVNLLKTDYYQKAIDMFPDKNFVVFSDDPEYCRTLDLFKPKKFQVMDRNDEIEDLNIMASCEGNIIANSSYSWWAAYLNHNFNKKIVAPSAQNWYSDGVERTKCPPTWIRI